MKENRFQTALARGDMPSGHMIMEFATRGVAKILEAAGLDYVVLDMEHSGFDLDRIADVIAWLKATPVTPFVRVPQGLYHFITRCLDAGALGVMVGNVETAEQAQSIVRAAKYPPVGVRGVGLGTAHNDYVVPDTRTYLDQANANTTVICQIESPQGIANLDAIAGITGVDVLWVGHNDLSVAMGIGLTDQRFDDALGAVVAAANRHGKVAAIQPGNFDQAAKWSAMGFHVLSWKTDIGLYRDTLRAELARLREIRRS